MLAYRHELAVERADLAIAAADRADASAARAHALVNKGTALSFMDARAGRDVLESGIDLAFEIGAHEDAVRGNVNMSWTALERRELDEAIRHADRAIDLSIERNLHGFEIYGLVTRGTAKLLRGEWVATDDLAPLLARQDGWATWRVVLLTLVGTVRARRGSPDAADLLGEAWELATKSQELQRTGFAAAAMAELAWIQDKPRLTTELIGAVLEHALADAGEWMAGALAYWAWKLGAIETSPPGICEPHQLQIGGSWKEASEAWQTLGMPYEQALALSEGDDGARLQALEMFETLGADAVAAKLRAELRSAGIEGIPKGPQRATRSHPAGLTERQSEVLEWLPRAAANPRSPIAYSSHRERSITTCRRSWPSSLCRPGAKRST